MDDKKKHHGLIVICVIAVICVAVITGLVLYWNAYPFHDTMVWCDPGCPEGDYSGHVLDPFPDDTDDDLSVSDDDLSAVDDDISVSDESGLEDALSAFLDGYLDSRRAGLKSEIMESLRLGDYNIADRYLSDIAERYANLFFADDIGYDISVEAGNGTSFTADVTFYYTGRLDDLADVCAVAMTAGEGFVDHFLTFVFVADDCMEYLSDDQDSRLHRSEKETVSIPCSFSRDSGLTASLSVETYDVIDGVICAGVTEYYRDAILYLLREGVDGLDDFDEKFPWPEEELYSGDLGTVFDSGGHVIDPFDPDIIY